MEKIVAITSCPVGIAHTYMAAENLEKAGNALGVEVKVETHGSIGIESKLSSQDIQDAVGVIIAADTKVDKSRFDGKPLITVGVQEGIHQSQALIKKYLIMKPISIKIHYQSPKKVMIQQTKVWEKRFIRA